jgi:SAM-dependent methyltransferase
MARHGLDVMGVDLSEGMVRRARKKGVRAEVMDFQSPSLAPGTFDGIWAARSLQHLPKAELPAVLGTVRRLLRPGGRFFMVVYEGQGEGPLATDLEYYTAQRYFAFYQPADLRAMLANAGFLVYREWRRHLQRPRHKEVLLAFASSNSEKALLT